MALVDRVKNFFGVGQDDEDYDDEETDEEDEDEDEDDDEDPYGDDDDNPDGFGGSDEVDPNAFPGDEPEEEDSEDEDYSEEKKSKKKKKGDQEDGKKKKKKKDEGDGKDDAVEGKSKVKGKKKNSSKMEMKKEAIRHGCSPNVNIEPCPVCEQFSIFKSKRLGDNFVNGSANIITQTTVTTFYCFNKACKKSFYKHYCFRCAGKEFIGKKLIMRQIFRID